MSTVVLVPMLGRAHRIAPLAASLAAATPEPHRLLFVVSRSDHDVRRTVDELGLDSTICPTPAGAPGDYARKINHGASVTDEPWIFLGADDLAFHPGWLTAAITAAGDRAGVIGTQDLGNARVIAGEHATHSLVARRYVDEHGTVDERGKVLHEGYPHEFVDDELVATAKARGAWVFAGDSIVEHLHPNWSKAPTDALYNQQRRRMKVGRRIFEQRRHLWEGLRSPA